MPKYFSRRDVRSYASSCYNLKQEMDQSNAKPASYHEISLLKPLHRIISEIQNKNYSTLSLYQLDEFIEI